MLRWVWNYFKPSGRQSKTEISAPDDTSDGALEPFREQAASLICSHPQYPLQALWEALNDRSCSTPQLAMAVVKHPSCGIKARAGVQELFFVGEEEPHGHGRLEMRQGSTPLMLAALANRVDVVKVLLAGGSAGLYINDSKHVTSLHAACYHGNVPMIELLNQNGLNPNRVAAIEPIPFQLAAKHGHVEALHILLQSKYSSAHDIYLDSVGGDLLHWAVKNNLLEAAEALLHHNYQKYATDFRGRTPLHVAVEEKHERLVKLLLVYGADVNAQCHLDMSPLQRGVRVRAPKVIIDCLLDNGGDMDHQL